MRRTVLFAGAVLAAFAFAPLAGAQSAPAAVVPVQRLRALGDSLTPGASRTAQLGAGPGYTYAVTHRDSTGGVEAHDAWTDMFVVQSGSATLVSGGTLDGARQATPGEWRGGAIRGGHDARVRPGDVVTVPAGTPHQMVLAAGERITYLAFKIAKPTPHP
jgi:mannose-6-phosphate isomerase-like protein (cupin superfamily)